MGSAQDKKMIVGLDIGTSKVVAIVGEIGPEGTIEVVGIGSHPSKGMKKGVVVNIESTVQSIQRAVEEAELMAGCQIHSVYVGIAGSHIRSLNSHGIVAIKDREVYSHDLERVIDAAQAVAIPADQKILHILPQEYVIDNQEGIKEPLGMSGVRLEAKVHLVTCAVNAAQNIEKCIRRCGLEVEEIILEQLASSYAVLTDDERELGVCLVDIGGGTTDIAIFTDGSIRHTGVIPIAGDQVTNDIAMALRTPTQHAEEIKIRYACALTQLAGADETHQGAQRGGPPAPGPVPPGAGRGGRAALRRTVHPGPGGVASQWLRGPGARGRCAQRRHLKNGRCGRVGGGDFSHAGASGLSAFCAGPERHRAQPDLRHQRGSVAVRGRAPARRRGPRAPARPVVPERVCSVGRKPGCRAIFSCFFEVDRRA